MLLLLTKQAPHPPGPPPLLSRYLVKLSLPGVQARCTVHATDSAFCLSKASWLALANPLIAECQSRTWLDRSYARLQHCLTNCPIPAAWSVDADASSAAESLLPNRFAQDGDRTGWQVDTKCRTFRERVTSVNMSIEIFLQTMGRSKGCNLWQQGVMGG